MAVRVTGSSTVALAGGVKLIVCGIFWTAIGPGHGVGRRVLAVAGLGSDDDAGAGRGSGDGGARDRAHVRGA